MKQFVIDLSWIAYVLSFIAIGVLLRWYEIKEMVLGRNCKKYHKDYLSKYECYDECSNRYYRICTKCWRSVTVKKGLLK